jgi:hypothetical protein
MQGLAYGPEILRAQPYEGFPNFLEKLKASDIEATIISHKTKHPYRGPRYDLHAAARSFLDKRAIDMPIHFEPTKESKIQRIADLHCDRFIDDLPEFLTLESWPPEVDRLLFDPGDTHADDPRYQRYISWDQIATEVFTTKRASA